MNERGKQATIMRARELVVILRRTDGPDVSVDRQLAQLYQMQLINPTAVLDEAKRTVKKYYQWGMRQYSNGQHGAYVEVNSQATKGFMWAVHRSDCIALLIASLRSHIDELEY